MILPPHEAHVLVGRGRRAAVVSHIPRAEALLRQAHEIFQRIGAADARSVLAEPNARTDPGTRKVRAAFRHAYRIARPQYPMDLAESPAQLGRLKMDDRVERDGSRELTVGGGKLEEIALTELHLRIGPAAGGDHGRRQVDTDRGNATASEPGCHMPRAAPQVGDRRTVFSLLGNAGQQSPVERFSCELAAEALQVLLGDSVITLADSVVLRDWPVHDESLRRLPLACDQMPTGHPQFIGNRCHNQ